MIEVFRMIFTLLDRKERRQFWWLTAFMVVVAIAEVFGISAVLVLLNVLSDPTVIHSNDVLSFAYVHFGFSAEFGFMVALSLVVLLVVILGLLIKAAGTYAGIRFSTMRGFSVSSRLLGAYLNQPYVWFLARNSSDVAKNVLVEVDGVVNRVMAPAMRMTASSFMVMAIVGLLMLVDPFVTVLSAGLLGLSYVLIYIVLRERLRGLGDDLSRAFGQRFRIAQEVIGGIKEVKLLGLEDSYIELYRRAARNAARSQATIGIVSEIPRFMLEAISFGTLLTLVLVLLMRSGGSIVEIVPTLGVFALSVMRLLPALQIVYQSLASIRGARTILEIVVRDHAEAVPNPASPQPSREPLQLCQQLELLEISFGYATAARPALRGLDLKIKARTTVGIVGGTGAGKTTLVDLVLGLLTPDSGTLLVDETPVTTTNLRAWQKSVGYVPQSIYLTDDTIAANIAFGIPKEKIDMAIVERAAQTAALHEYVSTELPQGYETVVGERGVRLSGGQRQRIGIARALYRDPTLLIMDEATSALDNLTERAVMDAIQNIRSDKTIILIAHRLTTVRTCDTIFLMEQGRVTAQGTYDELVADNATFRKMAVGV